MNFVGLVAQTQDFDVVGDLGFAQGQVEVSRGTTARWRKFQLEGLQLRHTRDRGFELIGVGPLGFNVGLSTGFFPSCRGGRVFGFWRCRLV